MENNLRRVRINHLNEKDLFAIEYEDNLENTKNEIKNISDLFQRKYKSVSMVDKYNRMYEQKYKEKIDFSEHEKLVEADNLLSKGDIDYIDFWSDNIYLYSLGRNGEYFVFNDSTHEFSVPKE